MKSPQLWVVVSFRAQHGRAAGVPAVSTGVSVSFFFQILFAPVLPVPLLSL